jgi:hypothetical protein
MPKITIHVSRETYNRLLLKAKAMGKTLYEYIKEVLENSADNLPSLLVEGIPSVGREGIPMQKSDNWLSELGDNLLADNTPSASREGKLSASSDGVLSEVSYSQHRGASHRLADILKQIVERLSDLDERVRIIEHVHWGRARINRAVEVYEAGGIPEELKSVKPVEVAKGDGVEVYVYEVREGA